MSDLNLKRGNLMFCSADSIMIKSYENNNNFLKTSLHYPINQSEFSETGKKKLPKVKNSYTIAKKVILEPLVLIKVVEPTQNISRQSTSSKNYLIGLLALLLLVSFSRDIFTSPQIPSNIPDVEPICASTTQQSLPPIINITKITESLYEPPLKTCRFEEILKQTCPADQDLCSKFKCELLSTSEKIKLIRDELHWVLNKDGNVLSDILTIEELNDCMEFLVISPKSIDVFHINSSFLRNLNTESPVVVYTMSRNKDILVYSTQANNVYLTTTKDFSIDMKISETVWFRTVNEVDKLISSRHSDYFFITFKNLNEVHCYTYYKTKNFINLKEISGRVLMLEVNKEYKDIILMDSSGIKIYYNFTDKPAYFIRDLNDLIRLKEKYIELELFQDKFFLISS